LVGPDTLHGAAIAVDVQFLTLSTPSLVTVIAFCDEGKIADAWKALDGEVKRLFEGTFSDGEFVAARNTVLARELYELETDAGVANTACFWGAAGGADTQPRYAKALATAAPADGKRVAREVFDPAKQIRLVWHAAGGSSQ
jgi:predicted Zn-dependent peptidase